MITGYVDLSIVSFGDLRGNKNFDAPIFRFTSFLKGFQNVRTALSAAGMAIGYTGAGREKQPGPGNLAIHTHARL